MLAQGVWHALWLGLVLAACGNAQDAAAPAPVPDSIEALIARGDYEGLDRAYAEALKEHPGDYRLTYNRALANYLGGKPEAARDHLLTVPAAGRNTAEYAALLATVQVQLGETKAALSPAQDAVRLDPANAEHWLRLGALYLRLKRGQHALDTYRGGAQRFPDRPEFLVGQGVVEEMLAKFPSAADIYRAVTEKFPRYEAGYCFLGQVQIKAVQPDEARATARQLLRVNAQSAYAEYLLAQADWITPGRAQEARPHLARALALNPHLAEAALLAGKAELQAGNLAKAIEHLKQAVQVAPQMEEGYFLLAKAYRQKGDRQQAEVELARFKKLRQVQDEEDRLLSNFLAAGRPQP